MFPETFVRRNVLAWSKPGDIVLDPFSGRGTTVLESLLNGRRALGCDINPVAVCLSKAKAVAPTLDAIAKRLDVLEALAKKSRFKSPESADDFFKMCFHEKTLRQLLYLRRALKWREGATDCFIAALVLGMLHGESHKSELCFSNRMPRTISTKPAYSVRWWKARACLPPERDVFAILRLAATFRFGSERPALKGRVVEGDARSASKLLRAYKGKVKLVVTSPPYLDITDYHEDQWLRLWFLGGPSKPISRQGKDDRHRRTSSYWQFLAETWSGVSDLLADSAQVVVRIGGTRLGQEELQEGLLKSLNSSGKKFKLAESGRSNIKNGQSRVFKKATDKAGVEYDFRFITR